MAEAVAGPGEGGDPSVRSAVGVAEERRHQGEVPESWRPIEGTNYIVSDRGRVARILAPQFDGSCCRVTLTTPDWKRNRKVHQLVLEAFQGPRPEGMITRHLDGDPENNCLENLCYGTQAENMKDMVLHGRHWQATKTRCVNGHELSPDRVYSRKDRPGRMCLECKRIRNKT